MLYIKSFFDKINLKHHAVFKSTLNHLSHSSESKLNNKIAVKLNLKTWTRDSFTHQIISLEIQNTQLPSWSRTSDPLSRFQRAFQPVTISEAVKSFESRFFTDEPQNLREFRPWTRSVRAQPRKMDISSTCSSTAPPRSPRNCIKLRSGGGAFIELLYQYKNNHFRAKFPKIGLQN